MPKTFSLYRKIGFTATREFNYFVWKNEVSEDNSTNTNVLYPIELINMDEYDAIPNFWDFSPAWPNRFKFNRRKKENLINLGVFAERQLVGYCVFEPNSEDISKIDLDKPYRKGVGSLLLHQVSKLNKCPITKMINIDNTSSSIEGFQREKNIGITGERL